MDEYIERETLIRDIVCNMAEFVGAPDDVLKHDEQCNYAINMIEDAPVADVAPVVHGRWRYFHKQNIAVCTECSFERDLDTNFGRAVNCPNCGAKMDGGDSDG